jgi:hypothetical protein
MTLPHQQRDLLWWDQTLQEGMHSPSDLTGLNLAPDDSDSQGTLLHQQCNLLWWNQNPKDGVHKVTLQF